MRMRTRAKVALGGIEGMGGPDHENRRGNYRPWFCPAHRNVKVRDGVERNGRKKMVMGKWGFIKNHTVIKRRFPPDTETDIPSCLLSLRWRSDGQRALPRQLFPCQAPVLVLILVPRGGTCRSDEDDLCPLSVSLVLFQPEQKPCTNLNMTGVAVQRVDATVRAIRPTVV